MIYTIQIEQQALAYIRHVLAMRPYSEVAGLITQLDAQQAAQDSAAAVPLDRLGLNRNGGNDG